MIARFLLQDMDRRGAIFLALIAGLAILIPALNLLVPAGSPFHVPTSTMSLHFIHCEHHVKCRGIGPHLAVHTWGSRRACRCYTRTCSSPSLPSFSPPYRRCRRQTYTPRAF